MDIDLDIEADEVAYIYLGTDKHNNLKNLDLPDSHPIDAISGLREVVDKVGRTEDGAEVNRIIGVRVNGAPLDIAEDRTVDVPVPTSYGYYLDIDGNTGVISLKDRNGVVLSTIDTNLERIVESGYYDADTNEIVLVLDDNSEIRIDASKLVDVYTADGETIVENGHVFSLSEGSKNALKDSADHIADRSNPHAVTKAQVGLGNVDNTSDMNKPISTLVQQALDGKAEDSAVVHMTGDEVIAGIKTFNSSPIVEAWDGLHVRANSVEKGNSIVSASKDMNIQFTDKNDTGNTASRKIGGIRFTVSKNVGDNPARTFVELGNQYYRDTYLRLYDNGVEAYSTTPSWSVGTNDNSDKIMNMKMVNSLPSLVHTTGNEDIAGRKTFSNNIIVKNSNPYNIIQSTVMDFTSTTIPQTTQRQGIYNEDLNGQILGGLEYTFSLTGKRQYALGYRRGHDTSVDSWSYVGIIETADGTVYGIAPATADTHPNDAIVTKKYLLDKIAALEARISALEGA